MRPNGFGFLVVFPIMFALADILVGACGNLRDEPEHRWLLLRRNDTTGEIAYCRCYARTRSRRPRWCQWPGSGGRSSRTPSTSSRRLFDALVIGRTATVEHNLNWSIWRRKHQATARRCHYRRRSRSLT